MWVSWAVRSERTYTGTAEKSFVRRVFLILIVIEERHEALVDILELRIIVDGFKDLVAVFVFHNTQENEAVIRIVFLHVRREEGHVGLAVIVHGLDHFQLELLAVIVYDGDKSSLISSASCFLMYLLYRIAEKKSILTHEKTHSDQK